MGRFSSDSIIPTTVGNNPSEEREYPSQSSRVLNATLGCKYCLKEDRTILVCFQGKQFNVTVIHVYAPAMDSLVAQTVKCLPATRETWVQFLGWEDPLEKEVATDSSTLA